MIGCWSFHDPGPCPVDDTPHTACTPESVGTVITTGRGRLVSVRVQRPRVLDASPAPVPVATPVAVFTQGTYDRRTHGKALGIRRQPKRTPRV